MNSKYNEYWLLFQVEYEFKFLVWVLWSPQEEGKNSLKIRSYLLLIEFLRESINSTKCEGNRYAIQGFQITSHYKDPSSVRRSRWLDPSWFHLKQEEHAHNIVLNRVIHNKLLKILKETTWLASWEICMQVKKQHLELEHLDMEQQTGSKSGKEYAKAAYCHPAYITYMQSISWKMQGWMKHKLWSRFPEEISTISDMQMTPTLWQKVKKN